MPSPKPVAGDVFVWGDNTCMVLGLTTRATGRKRPIPLALLDKTTPSGYRRVLPKCTVAVASGAQARSPSRRMATFGRWGVNDEGQLGRPIPEDDDEAPAVPGKVTIPGADPDAVVVGAATTDAATFALLSGRSVIAGSAGFKDDARSVSRQHTRMCGTGADALPIAAVAAGNTHLVMLTEPAPSRGAGVGGKSSSSAVLTAGAGAQGQLGRGRTPRRPAPRRGRSPRRRAGSSSAQCRKTDRRFRRRMAHLRAHRRRQGRGVGPQQLGTTRPPRRRRGRSFRADRRLRALRLGRRRHRLRRAPHRRAHARAARCSPSGARRTVDWVARPASRWRWAVRGGVEARVVSFPASAGKLASVAAGMKESAAVNERGTMFFWGRYAATCRVAATTRTTSSRRSPSRRRRRTCTGGPRRRRFEASPSARSTSWRSRRRDTTASGDGVIGRGPRETGVRS